MCIKFYADDNVQQNKNLEQQFSRQNNRKRFTLAIYAMNFMKFRLVLKI